ncbi:hypothetical protein L484_000375 [Morus notabilis]|uniref:DUF7950 domain-containing protein n=1 Tax=Morus notabilis TaxID=981085 RepID=W9SEN1_9ROSA|nr:uncharacterized protein LOC21384013 [Morus notabilis]XP_010108040.1 uncharacterized protein LOC21387517 [Morus notabilis]EXC17686.1 hypothetical protein L484_004007 [Morus notabilis]EXC49238.1 hypothetical protein L484_000375 [Morus notabilis]
MIKTLNPYATTAKTAEIMSRYRPIAPKPETPTSPTSETTSTSQKIRQSPYLRNLWPQLQARPTRTRKRGRAALSPPSLKRQRTNNALGLTPPYNHLPPLQGFSTHGLQQIPTTSLTLEKPAANLVTLPLLPSTPIVTNQAAVSELDWMKACGEEKQLIDLNTVAEIPEEKDLLQQLQRVPVPATVIAPQPVRPVGSSICVRCISEDPKLASQAAQAPKKPEEVEEEVESEILPAVISDSNNKVRMANSAYKEMVGQPECSWLDSMMTSSCKRIGGEVILQLSDSRVPISSNGFSCWVRIEWGSDENKNSVNAFCDVIRLSCESKDYVFTWRFHIHHTREASQSSCNV